MQVYKELKTNILLEKKVSDSHNLISKKKLSEAVLEPVSDQDVRQIKSPQTTIYSSVLVEEYFLSHAQFLNLFLFSSSLALVKPSVFRHLQNMTELSQPGITMTMPDMSLFYTPAPC